MRRNRRAPGSGVRLAPMVKVLLVCGFLGGAAVGYVLQKNKLHELGRIIKEREVALERVRWENKVRADQLAEMQLPQRLAERVRRENLGLAAPHPGRVVWLSEPPAVRPGLEGPDLLVLRQPER